MDEKGAAADEVQNVATPAKAGSPKGKRDDKKKDTRQSSMSQPPPLPPNLQLEHQLGKGAYGDVWLCKDLKTKEQVAVKWVRDFTRDSLFGKRILREIRILAQLKHQNLLKLTDLLPPASPDFSDVFIVMPYMHSDLARVIYSKMPLSASHAQAFACQILRGLKYLHSAGVVHRDLKPANILVNKDCTVRIADYGLARGRASEDEVLTEYVVTRWYRAPELFLMPSGYFEAVDLWSVGCIHAELLTRQPLFPGENNIDMLRRMVRVIGFVPERDLSWVPAQASGRESMMIIVEQYLTTEVEQTLETCLPNASEVCVDFIRQLLAFDPTQRISACAALSHPYIKDLCDPVWETVAAKTFSWDFDRFEPTVAALKDRVYVECARIHPDILTRDAALLAASDKCHLLAEAASMESQELTAVSEEELALRKYEDYYNLAPGTATVRQVMSSSAGIRGWATSKMTQDMPEIEIKGFEELFRGLSISDEVRKRARAYLLANRYDLNTMRDLGGDDAINAFIEAMGLKPIPAKFIAERLRNSSPSECTEQGDTGSGYADKGKTSEEAARSSDALLGPPPARMPRQREKGGSSRIHTSM